MQTRKAFYARLGTLQDRFNAMQPEMEVTLRDPQFDVEGHIVVWNTGISRNGPLPLCAKGGTRIREGLTLEEVRMLARNMAIKNAAAGLPLGGCKSGLNADPGTESFENTYRRFVELCKPFTYENGGTFGGFGFDIGAAPEHALWACDTLQSTRSFTGKPVEMGGTDYDREGIAGLGVADSAAELLKMHEENIQHMTFAIHGAGALGSAVLRYLCEKGANLVGLGDPKFGGAWWFKHAISKNLSNALVRQDVESAREFIRQEGQHLSDNANDVLYCHCDILFPCAVQHVIHTENVDKIKSRYIVEGANNPTTADAYPAIFHRGIHHVPDFIANAGGVIAAFIELTSTVSDEENTRTKAKVKEAKSFTSKTIKNNIHCLLKIAENYRIPLRDAGMYIALEAIVRNEFRA